jgi:hypothetical protein
MKLPSWSLERMASGIAAGAVLAAVLSGSGGAAPEDRPLFDAPRGGWLGTVRADAPVVVLEEREGWRRVRIEAWMPAAVPAPEGDPPAAAGSGGTAGAGAAPRAAGAIVRGVLLPVHGLAATPGGGLPVLLVGDLAVLDREHADAAERCRDGRTRQTAEIERLRRDLEQVLTKVDNFRDAVTRGNRIKEDLRAAEKTLLESELECRARADEIYGRHAVARTVADTAGRFEFADVRSGRYRVVALDGGSQPPRAWSMECDVAEGGTRTLDPRADRSPVDPYWRSPAGS